MEITHVGSAPAGEITPSDECGICVGITGINAASIQNKTVLFRLQNPALKSQASEWQYLYSLSSAHG